MTQTEPRQFRKTVAIKTTDDDERTATGAALVPFEVDRQRDYFSPDGIEAMYNPDPDDGVMHHKFADDDAELVRNEIIDESETIGDQEYPAGSWIVRRKYHDDELWQLVKDGVLNGFSIGGDISEEIEHSLDELPEEISFPAEVAAGPATQVLNGFTAEISDVDITAVPNADHATVKSATKNLVEQASDEDEFIELMEPRGHSPDEASRLWGYLEKTTQHMSSDTDTPDSASIDDVDNATLGKRFKEWLLGGGTAGKAGETAGVDSDPPAADLVPTHAEKAIAVAKEGRTLNESNRETLMAAHDAIEAALASDMDFETNRFTDNEGYDFTLGDYGSEEKSKTVQKLTSEQGDLVVNAIQRFVDAQGEATFEEFREWVWQTDVLDDDTKFAADEATWAYWEYARDQLEQTPVTEDFASWVMDETETDTEITMSADTSERLDEIESKVDALVEKLTETNNDGEEATKNADGEGGSDADVDPDELAQKLDSLDEKIGDLDERIDKVAKSGADTDQVEGGGADGGTGGETDESQAFKNALGGH
jgi:hypothetical protein